MTSTTDCSTPTRACCGSSIGGSPSGNAERDHATAGRQRGCARAFPRHRRNAAPRPREARAARDLRRARRRCRPPSSAGCSVRMAAFRAWSAATGQPLCRPREPQRRDCCRTSSDCCRRRDPRPHLRDQRTASASARSHTRARTGRPSATSRAQGFDLRSPAATWSASPRRSASRLPAQEAALERMIGETGRYGPRPTTKLVAREDDGQERSTTSPNRSTTPTSSTASWWPTARNTCTSTTRPATSPR